MHKGEIPFPRMAEKNKKNTTKNLEFKAKNQTRNIQNKEQSVGHGSHTHATVYSVPNTLTQDGYGMIECLKRVSSGTALQSAVPVNKVSFHCGFILMAIRTKLNFQSGGGCGGPQGNSPRLNKPAIRQPMLFECRLLVTFAFLRIGHRDTSGCDKYCHSHCDLVIAILTTQHEVSLTASTTTRIDIRTGTSRLLH